MNKKNPSTNNNNDTNIVKVHINKSVDQSVANRAKEKILMNKAESSYAKEFWILFYWIMMKQQLL
ncbi:hypothetical protein [Priestia endophytica]|uniref:hypothetical protein n=1 Tax=Priestia endophytica TaxID=135735 RepID=UPI00227FFB8C|nr:hypothetical protein [Priestia endophytica]MCY8235004.1 hypothetical protein [Priestia endophytica]